MLNGADDPFSVVGCQAPDSSYLGKLFLGKPLPDGTRFTFIVNETPQRDLYEFVAERDRPRGAVSADARAAEARRVLVPGGRIVLIGQDWDTFVIDSDDAALTRTIVHARADLTARAARRYRNLLLEAGFGEVTVEVHTGVFTGPAMLPLLTGLVEGACSTGAVTCEQADAWVDEQCARAAADRLFLALPMFVAAATSPR